MGSEQKQMLLAEFVIYQPKSYRSLFIVAQQGTIGLNKAVVEEI